MLKTEIREILLPSKELGWVLEPEAKRLLRLAGLVRLNLEIPGERKYAPRLEGLEDTFNNIKEFLQADLNT